MKACTGILVVTIVIGLSACHEPGTTEPVGLRYTNEVNRPHTVVVNADANGNGTARTIQEAVDRVAAGGVVQIRPGVYSEAIVITKGVTLQPIADGLGTAVIDPPSSTATVIDVTTEEPVIIRSLHLRVPGTAGIRGNGAVNLTVEDANLESVNPPNGASSLVTVLNESGTTPMARLVVRNSFLDGAVGPTVNPTGPQSFAVRPQGDVVSQIEGNVMRRMGGACIFVVTRFDLGGELYADIVNNDLDQCHPRGRVGAILIGPLAGNFPSATRPITSTGTVNIVGNTIRNTLDACQPASAIAYELYTGRIEHNEIISVVKPCAIPTGRNLQGAIWLGRRNGALYPPPTPRVRYNDIVGNAYAGLYIAANVTTAINASCNFWGAANGPSGLGSGGGDAVLVEPGGATPVFAPFAAAPIARSGATSC